jgi:hypothetical protein
MMKPDGRSIPREKWLGIRSPEFRASFEPDFLEDTSLPLKQNKSNQLLCTSDSPSQAFTFLAFQCTGSSALKSPEPRMHQHVRQVESSLSVIHEQTFGGILRN